MTASRWQDLVCYDHKHNQCERRAGSGRHGLQLQLELRCGRADPQKGDPAACGCGSGKTRWLCCFSAQGAPMLLAGDEFGNTQDGNNNPYCHDSELTWLGWNQSKSTRELQDFVRESAIAYRKRASECCIRPRVLLCADRHS